MFSRQVRGGHAPSSDADVKEIGAPSRGSLPPPFHRKEESEESALAEPAPIRAEEE
jgi:hypothetical protein